MENIALSSSEYQNLNFEFLAQIDKEVSDLLFPVKSFLRTLPLSVLYLFDKVEISSKNISLLSVQTIPLPQQLQQLNFAPVSFFSETESVEIDNIEIDFCLSPGEIYFDDSPR